MEMNRGKFYYNFLIDNGVRNWAISITKLGKMGFTNAFVIEVLSD